MGSETFADRLKLAMELRNMKQVDLIQAAADQGIRLGKSHVSQYVNGKTIPRADILKGDVYKRQDGSTSGKGYSGFPCGSGKGC